MNSDSIIGHTAQRNALLSATINNRLSHAYIFSGQQSVGKKLVALEFAKLVNCNELEKSDTTTVEQFNCDCISCRKIKSMNHPDVHIFHFANSKTIKVDQIREDIENQIYLAPYESRFKIFIVDDAERMNLNAQNAFLKTVEEPPKNSIIILITNYFNMIIPTIKSRCQNIIFNKLSDTQIEQYLKENDINPNNRKLISKLARGSLGKAINLDENYFKTRKLHIEDLLKIDIKKPTTIFNISKKINSDTKSDNNLLDEYFEILSLWIKDSINFKLNSENIINIDLIDQLDNFTKNKTISQLIVFFNLIDQTYIDIVRHNANKQLAIENMLLESSN